MTPKTKLFEWMEEYSLGNLKEPEKNEFEELLEKDEGLKEELEFERELQAAINEKDVLKLREKLGKAKADTTEKKDISFDLLDDFTHISDLTSAISSEELLEYYDSLPKVHVYHHEIASKENIHPFYKEQNPEEFLDEDLDEEWDNFELEGLEEAVLEKDILNLRDTLSSVSRSVRIPFSTEEIDEYIQGNLTESKRHEFEEELKVNSSLQREVKMHNELEHALAELDISDLRNKISSLMESETSWNVTEENIEDYIDGTLEDEILEEFEAELNENSDLKVEVTLRRNVNESVGEKDVISLRDRLGQIQHDVKGKDMKSIVPHTKMNQMRWWKAGVAIAVLLIALGGALKNQMGSSKQVYETFYEVPEWSPRRSVESDGSYLQKANTYYNRGDYRKAIALCDEAISQSREAWVFHFFKGASLQNTGDYAMAIPEYTKVITQGDNLFIEEAEWYKSLCYLKLESHDKAKEQLLAIIERKGFYAQDAKAVLRRLRFSFK